MPLAPSQGLTKSNEMDDRVWRYGGMKFVVGKTGRNPDINLPRPVSSTTKFTWSDRGANSVPQDGGLTACAKKAAF